MAGVSPVTGTQQYDDLPTRVLRLSSRRTRERSPPVCGVTTHASPLRQLPLNASSASGCAAGTPRAGNVHACQPLDSSIYWNPERLRMDRRLQDLSDRDVAVDKTRTQDPDSSTARRARQGRGYRLQTTVHLCPTVRTTPETALLASLNQRVGGSILWHTLSEVVSPANDHHVTSFDSRGRQPSSTSVQRPLSGLSSRLRTVQSA